MRIMQQSGKKRIFKWRGLSHHRSTAYMPILQRSRSNSNMTETRSNPRKGASYAAALLAAAGLVLSPLMVPAFAARPLDSNVSSSNGWLGSFTPAGVDSRLAAKYAERSRLGSTKFPFTPAGIVPGGNRTMTVAARANAPLVAGAVSVRTAIDAMEQGNGNNTLRLASTSYRLTAARGWQGFVPTTPKLAPQKPLIELGRTDFRLDNGPKSGKSKFSTDISLGRVETVAPPARGASASGGDYNLNLGGAFSISKKVDLTAGVRYANERDRLEPTVGNRNDSEAVYVGTKIRF